MATKTVIEADGTIKSFVDWIKADGSTEFLPEKGRYHLYGQHMCPFSHRVTIGRVLKGLEDVVSYDNMYEVNEGGPGWKFRPEKEGCDADSINGYEYLREAYEASAKKLGASGFSGKPVVPTLYDKKLGRVVSNESADILRMFNSEFNEFCATPAHRDLDLFPQPIRAQIEQVEAWTRASIISMIFATDGPIRADTQESYDAAIKKLYDGLDKAETLLTTNRYLLGKQLTEADIRLFVTLIRFDPVYVQMKCSKKRICDYPALWAYTRDLYQTDRVRDTVNLTHIVRGSFLDYKVKPLNPLGTVPALPDLDYDAPANRENL